MSFRSRLRPFIQDKSVLLSEQFNYGHREVLIAANHLLPNTFFSCNIQHGWFGDYTRVKPIFDRLQRPYPRLVWSMRVKEALLASRSGTPIVTGAPWVHLLRACKIEPAKIFSGLQSEIPKSARLLVFPNHSIAGVETSHQIDLRLLVSEFSPNTITVCLYWLDFINPAVRRYYLALGCKLVCVGYRGGSGKETPWASDGGRVMFLPELLRIIEAHDFVAVSEVSSSFWYSISLCKPVLILDGHEKRKIWHKTQGDPENEIFINSKLNSSGDIFPFPFRRRIEIDRGILDLALSELGWDFSMNFLEVCKEYPILSESNLSSQLSSQIDDFIQIRLQMNDSKPDDSLRTN